MHLCLLCNANQRKIHIIFLSQKFHFHVMRFLLSLSCNCTSYLQDIQRYIWESIQKCTVTLITSFNFIFDAHTQIGLKHTIIMLPCVHHAYVLYFFRLFFHLFSKLPFFRLSCRRENDRMLLLS